MNRGKFIGLISSYMILSILIILLKVLNLVKNY